jgi:Zn-dependent peptidase ImmA (M78 family)/transcriptional regulator with XRE-family HTH domain
MVSKKEKSQSEHFAQRFKIARKMAGLSMEDLVKKTGHVVTRQAVSKYEKDIMRPGPAVLKKLAEAMNVNPDFFTQSRIMELDHLQFRQKSKLPRKEEEALKFKTINYLGLSHELEARLGMEKTFTNPAQGSKVSSLSDAEAAAYKVRKVWKLGQASIVNLLELLEDKGIKIFLTTASDDFDGMTAKNRDFHVMILNKDRPLDRLRFTAAHELAHILFHFKYDVDHEEGLCHSFAGAFLLPGEAMINLLGPKRRKISFWEWKHIKELYGISMQASIHRAYELQIISKKYFNNLMQMLRQKGWDLHEPFIYDGEEQAMRLKRLMAFALTEKIIPIDEAGEIGRRFLKESDLQDIFSS